MANRKGGASATMASATRDDWTNAIDVTMYAFSEPVWYGASADECTNYALAVSSGEWVQLYACDVFGLNLAPMATINDRGIVLSQTFDSIESAFDALHISIDTTKQRRNNHV